MFKGMSLLDFQKAFADKNDCTEYLAQMKWSKGFKCNECGNDKARTGNLALNKRCLTCEYEESPRQIPCFIKQSSIY